MSLFVDGDEPEHSGISGAILPSSLREDGGLPPLELSLDYMQQITRDMLEEDMLTVIAAGLGLHALVAVLALLLDTEGAHSTPLGSRDKENLVLILNSTGQDRALILKRLAGPKQQTGMDTRGLQSLDATTSASQRTLSYQNGGICFVTGRVLVVDILTEAIDVTKITGLIILHAENVGESSIVTFIVRLLRAKNRHAFIKAFSDVPARISQQLNGLSNKLKYLGVSKVALWPRFQKLVHDTLPNTTANEVIIEMSASMARLRDAVEGCMAKVISDLKSRAPEASSEDWNIEMARCSNIAQTVRIALESRWHGLSWEAKQSVEDLENLQKLLNSIDRSTPLEFLEHLELIRAASSDNAVMPSQWLELPEAQECFDVARQRVLDGEVPPKCEQLKTILGELQGKRVLVMCEHQRTLWDIFEYLQQGERYAEAKKRELEQFYASREKEDKVPEKVQNFVHVESRQPRGKRRRVRGSTRAAGVQRDTGLTGDTESLSDERLGSPTRLPGSMDPSESRNGGLGRLPRDAAQGGNGLDGRPLTISSTGVGGEQVELILSQGGAPELSDEIRLATFEVPEVLQSYRPDAVVIYEPNLKFTRQVEVYMAETGHQIQLFYMYYQPSVELYRYFSVMRQEKEAFSRLIREKGTMPMVIIDDEPDRSEGPRIVDTRVGGRLQRQVLTERPLVVVDTREFRSSLPYLIWQQKIDVVPLTLLVGDYVLSPGIVVERKTVKDLLSSFRDNRLVEQCKAMFRYYKQPMLLIEFDNDKTFSLEPFRELRTANVKVQRELLEKLVILLLGFPKLKIIWSASPRHTGEIFKALKANQPQPEPSQCTLAGQKVMHNTAALDILLAIPGVTTQNYSSIVEKVDSIQEFVELDLETLTSLVGLEAAQKISQFIGYTPGSGNSYR